MADEDGIGAPAKKLRLDPDCSLPDATKAGSTEVPPFQEQPCNPQPPEVSPTHAYPTTPNDAVDMVLGEESHSQPIEVEVSATQEIPSAPNDAVGKDSEGDRGDVCSQPIGAEGGSDDSSSDSSDVSELSDVAGEDLWKAHGGGGRSINWVYSCMQDGVDPRSILSQLISDEASLPSDLDDLTLWKIVISIVSEPLPRKKLENYNTLEDAVNLIKTCKKIIVLTGAGVSVSCGIPDFRSKNGIYARLAVDFPDLPDPQAMFDIRYFRREQRPFFKFAKEIYPGQFEPSKSHKFIQMIEQHGKLLRNYTQNIDTLEQVAGIKNVIQCHGSFATATCMACKHKVSSDEVKEDILNQVIPRCVKCLPDAGLNVMKPDIVFFGESLPEEFHDQMAADKTECDLLIVIGSSLKVRPVALIPNSLPENVPQILINKEHLKNLNFDIELLGDCDTIVGELCHHLGNSWSSLASGTPMTQIRRDELATPPASPSREITPGQLRGEIISSNKSEPEKTTATIDTSGKGNVKDTSVLSNTSSSVDVGSKADSNCTKLDSKPEDSASRSQSDSTKPTINKDSSKTDRQSTNADSGSKFIDTSNGSNSVTSTSECSNAETSKLNASNMQTSSDGSKIESSTLDGSKVETNTSDVGKTEARVSDSSKRGTSTSDRDNSGTSTGGEVGSGEPVAGGSGTGNRSGPSSFKSWLRPLRQNLALMLKDDQFCFIPPHQYIFPHAEFMVRVGSTDGPGFSASPGKYDLDRTYTTTESSFEGGDIADLLSNESVDGSDDEESRRRMNISMEADGNVKTSANNEARESSVGQVQNKTVDATDTQNVDGKTG